MIGGVWHLAFSHRCDSHADRLPLLCPILPCQPVRDRRKRTRRDLPALRRVLARRWRRDALRASTGHDGYPHHFRQRSTGRILECRGRPGASLAGPPCCARDDSMRLSAARDGCYRSPRERGSHGAAHRRSLCRGGPSGQCPRPDVPSTSRRWAPRSGIGRCGRQGRDPERGPGPRSRTAPRLRRSRRHGHLGRDVDRGAPRRGRWLPMPWFRSSRAPTPSHRRAGRCSSDSMVVSAPIRP